MAVALDKLGTPSDVLRRHGYTVKHHMSACPVCDGGHKTPCVSLYRGDAKDRWKCHSCEAGGDALDLEAAITGKGLSELL